MKKYAFLSVAFIALMLVTACNKNNAPTLTILNDQTSITEGGEVEVGSIVTIGFLCEGRRLDDLKVSFWTPTDKLFEREIDLDEVNTATEIIREEINYVGHITVYATLSDEKDRKTTVTMGFECVPKPVPSYEGYYEGFITVDGTIGASELLSMPIPDDSVSVSMTITPTDTEGIVNVSMTYDASTYETTGVIDGDYINFLPFDVEVQVEESVVTGTIDLNANKIDETLSLGGNVSGQGTMTLPDFPIPLPVTLEGQVNGILYKIRP